MVGHMLYFFIVSHSYMTSNAKKESSRSVHQEILEEGRAREDHGVDVLLICHRIVVIEQEGI